MRNMAWMGLLLALPVALGASAAASADDGYTLIDTH